MEEFCRFKTPACRNRSIPTEAREKEREEAKKKREAEDEKAKDEL